MITAELDAKGNMEDLLPPQTSGSAAGILKPEGRKSRQGSASSMRSVKSSGECISLSFSFKLNFMNS